MAGALVPGLITPSMFAATYDPLMRVDADLAMVWAPFEFRVNGKVDHCATDLFNLVHMDGKWLIANFAATVRKDCGAK